MQEQNLDLHGSTPGQRLSFKVLRFGTPGAGPKATIQAALHADEVPALLVAHHLRQQLLTLEAAGQLIGEVQLVPYANPLGLAQQLLGQHQGRFDLRDGINFNRYHPDLADAAWQLVQKQLGDDAASNVALVRQALRAAAAELTASNPAQDLKRKLVQLAIDSDIVLDLHCDSQAVMHLYGLTPQQDHCAELGALLGAQAVLLATESGDSPFDEACSRPWLQLQQRLAPRPLPLACFCATVELRGESETTHELAQRDASALIEFLRRRGVLRGPLQALPPALCEPTPLAGSEPITAPSAGIVVFHHEPGARLQAGDTVADVVDIDSGAVHAVRAQSAGLLYARIATRWATPGMRLAKIAGTSLARTGKLLSA